jgi:hypothetical protein
MREHDLKLEDFDLDEIESIELIGEEDTIDITVEDTHMFFANDIYTHNSSIGSAVVQADQMGGSIKKGQIGHFVVSIAKTLDQKADKTATMAILKSRFGLDGVIFENILFDNARIQIDMSDDMVSRSQRDFKKDKDNDDVKRGAAALESIQLRKKALTQISIEDEIINQ